MCSASAVAVAQSSRLIRRAFTSPRIPTIARTSPGIQRTTVKTRTPTMPPTTPLEDCAKTMRQSEQQPGDDQQDDADRQRCAMQMAARPGHIEGGVLM